VLGALAAQGCDVSSAATMPSLTASPTSGSQVASFGWELCNLNGNGGNTYVEILANMVLQTVNADLSASILTASRQGFAEILCGGGVSRQSVPQFNSSPQAYVKFPGGANFGTVAADNPNNLSFIRSGVVQDQFLSVILKTWVPPDGSGCATSRQVLVYPALSLSAGDYLVFHMDHVGVALDAEMQIVLAYTLT
jgi:hypothetical protein